MESLADDLRTLSFAMYKGVKVAVYRVDKAEITLSRKDLVELINVCIVFVFHQERTGSSNRSWLSRQTSPISSGVTNTNYRSRDP